MPYNLLNKNVLLMNIDKIPKLIKNENGQDLIEYGGQKGVTGKGLLFYSERFSNWALLALLLSFGSVVIGLPGRTSKVIGS